MSSAPELALRVVAAMLAGLVLGLERDWKDKPVDFRAYAIVAAISAMLAVLNTEIVDHAENKDHLLAIDPLRTIQLILFGWLMPALTSRRDVGRKNKN